MEPVEGVGLDGDMLEAHAFAYLAVRVAAGDADLVPRDDRGERACGWRDRIFSGAGCRGERVAVLPQRRLVDS